MDLLKEKYLDLLKWNKKKFPYINEENNNELYLSEPIIKLPKFLKHLHVDKVYLSICDRLTTLENCPVTKELRISGCKRLKSLEGIQQNEMEKLYISDTRVKTFKGIPKLIHNLYLYDDYNVATLRNSLELGEGKSKIENILYAGYKLPNKKDSELIEKMTGGEFKIEF